MGCKTIISDNTAGNTKITLTFELGKSVDLMAPDVQRAITAASANLPDDLPSSPTYDKDNPIGSADYVCNGYLGYPDAGRCV